MANMGRGEKAKLADIGCGDAFPVVIALAANGLTIDVSCFGLDAQGKLSDERYMVFFNQKAAPDNAICMDGDSTRTTFATNVGKLPASIERVVFAAAIDGEGSMKSLGASSLQIGERTFAFSGADFDTEKAVIVGELYRRDGSWRFGAVGQGFAGGLSALLAHFGGTEDSAPAASAPAAAPAPAAKPVNLSKVTLTKPEQRHSISLVKGPAAPAKLIIKATWEDNGDGNDDNDDLDIRVGILRADGSMSFVCAPDSVGSVDRKPYVFHTGDVQQASKAEPATEIIEVNPAIVEHMGGRVALVFSVYSAVGNGAVSVASLRPKMRMEYAGQVVECAFDFTSSPAAKRSDVYTYVIGTAVFDKGAVELAPSGMTSTPGSEATPWMTWASNGKPSITMDGPIVFKGRAPVASTKGKQYVPH